MATYTVRKHGKTWGIRIYMGLVNGKEKEVTRSGFKTKKEAIETADGIIRDMELNQNAYLAGKKMTYNEFLDLWLEAYCKVNLKDTTCAAYQKRLNTIIRPVIGNYDVRNITPFLLQNFLNDLFQKGYSRCSLCSFKGLLSGSFSYAVKPLGIIQTNPMDGVTLPGKEQKPRFKQERRNGFRSHRKSGQESSSVFRGSIRVIFRFVSDTISVCALGKRSGFVGRILIWKADG